VPLFFFAKQWMRTIAALVTIGLQILIALTGNYAFFNYLTIALCLLLFDNAAWPARLRAWFERPRRATRDWEKDVPAPPPLVLPASMWEKCAGGLVMTLVFMITIQPPMAQVGLIDRWPPPFSWLREATGSTMSFNGYGLFAVMTTSRHEIEVEGSNDGVNWRSYDFTWKPGDMNQRPALVAPHQPRLDWQMWFAALGEVQQNPWFINMMVRLLEGSPEVSGLLEHNPFPNGPPRFMRASLYDYHFTRYGDGQPGWWKREPLGLYCPVLTLEGGRVVVVREAGRSQ